jgi:hypothetical protein
LGTQAESDKRKVLTEWDVAKIVFAILGFAAGIVGAVMALLH